MEDLGREQPGRGAADAAARPAGTAARHEEGGPHEGTPTTTRQPANQALDTVPATSAPSDDPSAIGTPGSPVRAIASRATTTAVQSASQPRPRAAARPGRRPAAAGSARASRRRTARRRSGASPAAPVPGRAAGRGRRRCRPGRPGAGRGSAAARTAIREHRAGERGRPSGRPDGDAASRSRPSTSPTSGAQGSTPRVEVAAARRHGQDGEQRRRLQGPVSLIAGARDRAGDRPRAVTGSTPAG